MKNLLPYIFLLTSLSCFANQDSILIEQIKAENQNLKAQIEAGNRSNELLQTSVENYNHRTSSLEIMVGVLGGLVGLISLAIPLIIYLFQIRPAEKILEEVKDVDKTVENKLQAYIKEEENKRIDKALNEITDTNEKISNDAIMILSFNQTHDFSEEQYFKVYKLLKSDLPFGKKSILSMILASSRNEFADEFFTGILKDSSAQIFLHQTIKYFALVGLDSHIDEIIEYILTANDATNNRYIIPSNYVGVGTTMMMNSKRSFEKLINNPILNSGLDKEIKKQLFDSFSSQAKIYGVSEILEKSLLAKGLEKNEQK